jgi:hypothetical protein
MPFLKSNQHHKKYGVKILGNSCESIGLPRTSDGKDLVRKSPMQSR